MLILWLRFKVYLMTRIKSQVSVSYYKTIAKPSEGFYRDRGSKFYAYMRTIKSVEDVRVYLEEISNLHPKARHICYAYRLESDGSDFRINDDGEPSGSAGRPIFNELLSSEITFVLAAVVRYFGGTKLGIPGLIAAYKGATKEAINGVQIIKVVPKVHLHIDYRIQDMGKLYDLLKRQGVHIEDSLFDPSPKIVAIVPEHSSFEDRRRILAEFHGYSIDDIDEHFESDQIQIAIGMISEIK